MLKGKLNSFATRDMVYKYKHRDDPEIEDKCPHCQCSHTTIHLFDCPNNPTTLEVRDLWTNPVIQPGS